MEIFKIRHFFAWNREYLVVKMTKYIYKSFVNKKEQNRIYRNFFLKIASRIVPSRNKKPVSISDTKARRPNFTRLFFHQNFDH
jgi:hypothetical protein